jgi:hypothetical protein
VDSTTRSALSYAAQSPEEVPAAVILQLADYGALDLHPWSINKHHPTLHNRTQVGGPGCSAAPGACGAEFGWQWEEG